MKLQLMFMRKQPADRERDRGTERRPIGTLIYGDSFNLLDFLPMMMNVAINLCGVFHEFRWIWMAPQPPPVLYSKPKRWHIIPRDGSPLDSPHGVQEHAVRRAVHPVGVRVIAEHCVADGAAVHAQLVPATCTYTIRVIQGKRKHRKSRQYIYNFVGAANDHERR